MKTLFVQLSFASLMFTTVSIANAQSERSQDLGSPEAQNPARDEERPALPTGQYVIPSGYNRARPNQAPAARSGIIGWQPEQRAYRHARIRYEEGMELPPGAQIVRRRRRGLLVAGLATFLGAYLPFASLGILLDEPVAAIPVFGLPLLALQEDTDVDATMLSFVVAAAQLGGILLFAFGMKKREYVQYPRFALAPFASPTSAGVGLTIWR